jgi:uncharacterized protein (TIGR04255 family)
MAARRHLKNAPITEALVDLRASATREFTPESLVRLQERLRSTYPTFKESRAFETRVEIKPGQAPVSGSADKGLHGYFFESSDAREIAQFRMDGFTYNRLHPYTDGQRILDEALRLWAFSVEVAAPTVVSRVALRYINHLRLPVPVPVLASYLTAPPVPPQGAHGEVETFLTRIMTYDPGTTLSVVTTQASEKGIDPSLTTVILDIDAFRVADLGVGVDDLRPTLEALRSLKNDVFFGSISERTVELYE